MEVTLKDGALSARLEAETPAARAALLDNLPALRERLAEQNVRIDKFDVDLQDQTSGGPGNGPTSDADTDRNPRSPHWRGFRREQESAAIAPAPVPVSTSGLDQLNVVI
jgi:flagellar hook-length control protein FliK